ncbi:MAG: tetratricopeptide repeat protein [Rhodospirillaceae bacterium]|nr:tetratricopeptide repeat protein [Rhodospirillaceae bacterium]
MNKPPLPSSKSSADLAKAQNLHAAGRLADARALYERAFAADRRDTAAVHGLGLIAIDQGRPLDALPLFARCMVLAPDNPVFRASYGLALLEGGKPEDAAGHLLDAANRAPEFAEARVHLARALIAMKRRSQAFDVLADTVARFPARADAWSLKGTVERALGRSSDAEQSLRRAADLAPEDPGILNNLGAVLRDQGHAEAAIALYRKALALAPSRAVTRVNLGNALAAIGHLPEAEAHLRKALLLDPVSSDAGLGLALLLAGNERGAEAIPLLQAVLARDPANQDAAVNLGVALLAGGDVAGAEAAYRDVLARAPKNAEAHYNLAWVLLLTGRWREAWPHFDWRWKLKYFSSRARGFKKAPWDGTQIQGTLLVHAEQGMGDAIQFGRLLAEARKRCDRLVFECHRPLIRLLASLPGVDEIVAAGDPLPPFAQHIPLMSLPGVLDLTPETIPGATGYLTVPAPAARGNRIGLVWAGSPDNKIDKRRSIPARLFAPLLATPGLEFVSLQVGPRAEEAGDLPGLAAAGPFSDFADTAATVAGLDLVIGVDTAVIHLAGAMGRPVWTLLPFMPDYRWLLGRSDSPWYASMRLFRQEKAGDWEGVIAHVIKALTDWQGKGG